MNCHGRFCRLINCLGGGHPRHYRNPPGPQEGCRLERGIAELRRHQAAALAQALLVVAPAAVAVEDQRHESDAQQNGERRAQHDCNDATGADAGCVEPIQRPDKGQDAEDRADANKRIVEDPLHRAMRCSCCPTVVLQLGGFSVKGEQVRTTSYMPGSNLAMVSASSRNGRGPGSCRIAIVLQAAPLGTHGHLCTVDAAMESRRNEPRRADGRAIGRASEKIDKPLLVDWLDREDVYQRDDTAPLGRSTNAQPSRRRPNSTMLNQKRRMILMPWKTAFCQHGTLRRVMDR